MLERLRVLFLCTGNSARSQMAEGFARSLKGGEWEAFSAGTAPVGVNPLAVRVMAEAGVDIASQRSKRIEDLGPMEFDWVVTLCGEAEEACPIFPGKTRRLHRGLPDPARVEGDEKHRLAAFRQVRDQIRFLIERLPVEFEQDIREKLMKIEILGTGCAKCKKLFELLSQAVRETGLAAEVTKVDDIQKIMAFNVMNLPAVAIDGKVVLAGRVPTLDEAKGLLKAAENVR